ncbi:uridine kinase, partial [Enterobacter cloacae]
MTSLFSLSRITCAFDWYHAREIPIIAAFDAPASSFLNIQVNQVAKFMTDKSHQCVIIGIAGAS